MSEQEMAEPVRRATSPTVGVGLRVPRLSRMLRVPTVAGALVLFGALAVPPAVATPGVLLAAAPRPARQVPDTIPMPDAVPEAAELALEPAEVLAGMFFDGATVRVTARVPSNMGIAVSLVGTEEPVTLNRKGKALGLIWMNVGEVEIDGAPDLYLLDTSVPLDELAPAGALAAVGVGYGALEDQTTLRGTEGDDALYFQEFVSLKESDGLYTVDEGAVELAAAEGGWVRAGTDLRLSPKTPTGEYEILIHGFGAQGAVLLGRASLRVRQVGMAASIRTLAVDHGLLYGILAVVVAIVVGLLTGVLFGLGSKKAH